MRYAARYLQHLLWLRECASGAASDRPLPGFVKKPLAFRAKFDQVPIFRVAAICFVQPELEFGAKATQITAWDILLNLESVEGGIYHLFRR